MTLPRWTAYVALAVLVLLFLIFVGSPRTP